LPENGEPAKAKICEAKSEGLVRAEDGCCAARENAHTVNGREPAHWQNRTDANPPAEIQVKFVPTPDDGRLWQREIVTLAEIGKKSAPW
jgi:hypothetical protein